MSRVVSRARSDSGDELVDLRCSVIVTRGDEILLIHRLGNNDDWVLPGGRPTRGETLGACARREALEETGLRVHPHRCALLGEVIAPGQEMRVVDVVFLAVLDLTDRRGPVAGEPGTEPQWMALDTLRTIRLHPPIGGYLPALVEKRAGTAAYLGNLWRPDATSHNTRAREEQGDHGEMIWPT